MLDYHQHQTDARIVVREQHNPLWNILESRACEWEGGKLAVITKHPGYGFPKELMHVQVGDVFTLGGLRLRCVDFEIRTRKLYVMKDGLKSILYYWLYKALIPLDIIYRRLIITAMVWYLADDIEEGTIPSWRDLKIAKRFLKKKQ